jgi:hypothetical protein
MIKSLSLPKAAKEELGITEETNFAKGGSQVEPSGESEQRKETVTNMSQAEEVEDEEQKKESKEEAKANEDFKMLMLIFGEGKYHLVPSFFRTLIYLKKAKKEFSILFRTFGADLLNTVFEFNKFCNGEHPCYSGKGGTPLVKFDGSKGTKDLRISHRNQKALFYRGGADILTTKLVTGTLKRVRINA